MALKDNVYLRLLRWFMKRLLVCSEPDPPSVNMRDTLSNLLEWEEVGSGEQDSMSRSGDTYMLSSERWHIGFEDVLEASSGYEVDPELVIFMSRHSSESGTPTLTVHPLGNLHDNKVGGLPEKLVKAEPHRMTSALRRMHELNDMEDTEVSFEVTHHGPWIDRPTFFIEVGSDESNWNNKHAADILAQVLAEDNDSDHPVVIGVGGGHYAPRFTEAALTMKVDFGHMIPNYQIKDSDDEDLARMLRDSCESSGTKMIYLHRKSMKGPQASRIRNMADSEGLEMIKSSDFEPLDQ